MHASKAPGKTTGQFRSAAATTAARRGRPPITATAAAAPSVRKSGRRARRSPADLAKTKAEIVSLLGKQPKGLRAEEIRSKLGLSKQEVPRPIIDALTEKLITKKGQKRATTYFKR